MLRPLDITIIVLYLVASIVIGFASRGKQEDARDYFSAGGRLGGMFQSILVGLSIAATFFSGLSFFAYPSIVYQEGIIILLGLVSFPISWLVLRFWFLPRYLAINNGHPYQIIEDRFGSRVRTAAATIYVLLRLAWMSALIYAPTIAVMQVMGLGPNWFWPCVLILGLSSTVYATYGGIRSVIVTDALQMVVIIVGIATVILYVFLRLPVSASVAFDSLRDAGRLNLARFSLNPTVAFTVWTVLIGMSITNVGNYVADPMSLQRYLATRDIKSTSRSFVINALSAGIVVILLGALGLSLWAWYHHSPDAGLPAKADRIFPFFIATQLPSGISGMLIAAVLAATMSSITSGINTLSASLTLDFRSRLGGVMTAQQQLRFAKVSSMFIGVATTLCAGLVEKLGSIFDISQKLTGSFMGPLFACMLLAVSSFKVHRTTILVAMIVGAVGAWVIALSPLSSLWVCPFGFVFTLAFTFIGTLISNRKDNNDAEPTPAGEMTEAATEAS